jgi:hypothetical protein
VRQFNGVGVGVSVGGDGVKVLVGAGVEVKVGGTAVIRRIGSSDGAQPDSPERSVSKIIDSIVA